MVFFCGCGQKKGFTECFPPFSGNPSTGALELRSSLGTIGHVWQIFDPSRCTTTRYFRAKGRCGGGEKQLGTENGEREKEEKRGTVDSQGKGGRPCLLMAAASTSNNIEVDFPPPNNN